MEPKPLPRRTFIKGTAALFASAALDAPHVIARGIRYLGQATPLEVQAGENQIYFNTFTINEQNNPLDTYGNPVFVNGESVGLFNSVPKAEDGPDAKARRYFTIIGEGNPNRVPESWFDENGNFDYNMYYAQVLQNFEVASQMLEPYDLAPVNVYLKNTGDFIQGEAIVEGGPPESLDDCVPAEKASIVLTNRQVRDDLHINRANIVDWFLHETIGHMPFLRNKVAPVGEEALAEALDLTILEDVLQKTGILGEQLHNYVLAQWVDRAVGFEDRMNEKRPIDFKNGTNYDLPVLFASMFHTAGVKDIAGLKQFIDTYIKNAKKSPHCNDPYGIPVQIAIDSLKEIAPEANLPSNLNGMITSVLPDFLKVQSDDPELREILEVHRDIITPNVLEFTPDGPVYEGNGIKYIPLDKGYFQRYKFDAFDQDPDIKHIIAYMGTAVVYGLVDDQVVKVESGSDLKGYLNDQGQLEVIIFNSTEVSGTMFFQRAEYAAYLPSIQTPGITTET